MTAPEPRRWPAPLRALRHRDYRLFWSAQLVSLTGTWMQSVAISWLVLELTGSPLRLGLIGTFQFSPMLFLSFVAGALADRVTKRRLMLTSQSVMAAQALLLTTLVMTGRVEYWHVAALSLLYGIANTVDIPARQAFVVEMVGRDDLRGAIALNSAMFNTARVLGPAVAGVIIARWGVGWALFGNTVSFVAVLAALLLIRAQGAPRLAAGASLRRQIAEGIAYAARTPRIALVLSLVLAVSALLFNYNVFVPLLARDVLAQRAEGFGVLMAALGVGSVSGALTLAMAGHGRPPVWALVTPALALAAATVVMANVRHFWLAAALLAVMGYVGILFMAGANTTLQLTVPDELRGRIMSLHAFAFAGMTPIGAFLVGSLAEAFGVATGLAVTGSAGFVTVLALATWGVSRARPAGA